MDLVYWVKKAAGSRLYLAMLNAGLHHMVPFNRSHGIRITDISDNSIETMLPYKRRNHNHIRSLHACALATLAEFTTGLLLIARLDPKRFRIIMKSMQMEYHYQGKTSAVASYTLEQEWLEQHVLAPLRQSEAATCSCKTNISDADGHQIAGGTIVWQVKPWDKVRTGV
jgi:acyl-coenzyme A thioesterase PaaI-like protein